jgi:hypothetical protein
MRFIYRSCFSILHKRTRVTTEVTVHQSLDDLLIVDLCSCVMNSNISNESDNRIRMEDLA